MATITLTKKISFGGQDYLAVEVEEPTVGGIEAFEGAKAAGETDMAATIKMLVVEIGWPIEVVRKIRASDMVKISEALAPFVEAAGATGD
jgi:hypothetical protein